MLPLLIIVEVLGSLAIILGLQARAEAILLTIFSIIAAMIFHADFTDQIQFIMFMKNISIAGGLLLLVAHGPGSYALDNWLGKE